MAKRPRPPPPGPWRGVIETLHQQGARSSWWKLTLSCSHKTTRGGKRPPLRVRCLACKGAS